MRQCYTFERFFKATEKFLSQQQKTVIAAPKLAIQPTTDFLFIRKNRKKVKVFLTDILYIESLKDYIRIYTNTETHTVKYSITAFQELLDPRFLRIHRSFIINVDKITAYTKQDIEIGTIEVPIGESYRNGVGDYLEG